MDRHVVLLGDSIFDNGVYVPGEDAVIQQLRTELPQDWNATLLARDGDVTADVCLQIVQLPGDASDLVISVGGNDALQNAGLLERATSAGEIPELVAPVIPRFRTDYCAMLDEVLEHKRNTVACTIYDQCPFPNWEWREHVPIALGMFNDCIRLEAERRGVQVIELRDICTDPEDFSDLSPIEPSSIGGIKIVSAIIRALSEQ